MMGQTDDQLDSGAPLEGGAGGRRQAAGAGARQVGGAGLRTGSGPQGRWPAAARYALSVGLVAATTGIAAAIRAIFPVPDVEVLFLLTVVVVAIRLGRGPAILAAACGVAAYDYFFVLPLHTLAVADGRYILTFAMMFGVGFVVSELANRLRRQEQEAVARESRTAALHALGRALAGVEDPEMVARLVARHASEIFESAAFVFRADGRGELAQLAAAPEGSRLDPEGEGVVRWCIDHGAVAGPGTDRFPETRTLCAPLVAGKTLGALALARPPRAPLAREQRAFLDGFARQAAFAFERVRLADEARQGALRARTEEMRSSLLSTVSHDLRTPLASITGAATSLRDDANLDGPTRRELVESICDEAERLERLVANLLDMTRLESGGLVLRRDWIPLEEIVGSALGRLEDRLEDRPVRVELDAGLPLLQADPVLLEQVFINLLENAARYTPPGSPIEIEARKDGDEVAIEVLDRGPGIPPGDEERVFEKFFRGAHGGVPGAGLGLPICRGIVEAHAGKITGLGRPGGGARFRITLPAASAPPTVPTGEEAHH